MLKIESIEEVKNYWNSRPCNVKHSKKEVGTEEYFNEVESKKYFVEPHIKEIADFQKWEGKNVLEIGCGIGTDSISFARNGANISCFELSEESLNLCKKRFEVFKLQAEFFSGNAENISQIIPNKEYDLIYSFGVIHHTPNPENVIHEIKNFMGQNSEARIMLYSKYSWKTIENYLKYGYKFNFNFKKTVKYYAEAQLNCPVVHTYSFKEIKKLLKDFEVLDIRKDHIFPYIINHYVNNDYKKRLIFRLMPNFMFKTLESLLGWHTLITFKKK